MTPPTDPPGEAEARRAESELCKNAPSCRENEGCNAFDGCACAWIEDAAARIAALEAEVARLRTENADLAMALRTERDDGTEAEDAAYARGFSAAREAAAALVDCGCKARPDVMARLEQGLRARDACPYGNCSAEDAAAIRALRPAQAQQGDRDA